MQRTISAHSDSLAMISWAEADSGPDLDPAYWAPRALATPEDLPAP